MTGDRPVSRRGMLAAAGTIGALYGGSRLALAAYGLDRIRFERHARFPGPPPLIVDWTSRYESPTARPPAPAVGHSSLADASLAVALGQLAPGDRGVLVVRLRPEPGVEGDHPPVSVSLRPRVHSRAENGLSEPERSAGDTTPETGELQAAVEVRFWADVGFAWSGIGACNGRRDDGDPVLAAGTVESIDRAETDVRLAGRGSSRRCLRPGDAVCFGVEWAIPPDVSNVVQGDSVRFDLGIATEPCDI